MANNKKRPRYTSEFKDSILKRLKQPFLKLNQPNAAGANTTHTAEPKKLQEASKKDKATIKELQKELRRKEKALAETAALLVLRKKALAIWGTTRTNDQCPRSQVAVELIDEARAAGARLKPACEVLNISDRTYQRWTKEGSVAVETNLLVIKLYLQVHHTQAVGF